MSRFLDSKLSALTPYVPGEQPRSAQKLIKLNTNESPYPPSPKVIEALSHRRALEELRLYPDPTCEKLSRAIAKRFSLMPQNVAVGNGSDELLAFCFHALCPHGAVFPDITYGFYEVFCRMFDTEFSTVPLADDFTIDTSGFANSRATVFIANPNAPTGLALPLCKVEELLKNDPYRLVVVDEAYVDFGAESAASLIGKYDNLLVIQTMSKSRSLAGGRIGYALGSEALISDMNLMRFSFNPYNINRLSLIAGEAAILDEAYFCECCSRIIASRAYLSEKLASLGFFVTDSASNFVFAGRHRDIGADALERRLRERGILVRYFDKPRLRDFLRITVGSEEQCRALISEVEKILHEVKKI